MSLVTSATAVGPNTVVKTFRGSFHLNLYAIYVALSGLGNKSSPYHFIVKEIIKKITRNTQRKLLLPGSLTVEGMTKFINQITKNS